MIRSAQSRVWRANFSLSSNVINADFYSFFPKFSLSFSNLNICYIIYVLAQLNSVPAQQKQTEQAPVRQTGGEDKGLNGKSVRTRSRL